MKKKQGISLIVLIVTIIVIIILAAVLILTISKNNPIENAKEATFKEDVRAFQDDLSLTISKDYTDNQGQRNDKFNALGENVKDYISSFTDKYVGKFIIENDKLVGTDELTEREKKWAEDLNISILGKSDLENKKWDADATPKECFEWEGTVIVGINTDMLTGRNKLKIPSKCTEINPKYVSTYESYRSFMPELQEIEIPNTVTTIGDYAFHNARGIKSIVIPDSVTSIGDNAFSYCTNLENITIPDSVIDINISSAFSYTKWYDSLPDGPLYVGKVFYYKGGISSAITSFNIVDGTVSISDRALYGRSNLTNVIIPNSVKNIGSYAFARLSFTSIVIPEGVTNIGENAFDWCANLESITLPHSITSINDSTFISCSNLSNVNIPNSVTNIGDRVFGYCDNLANINFDGTINEWNNITKSSAWNYASPIQTITCTDGVITL